MDRACAIHKRLMALLAGAKHVRLLDGHLDSLAKHTLDKAGLEAAVWSQVNHKTHPQRKVKLLFSKTDDEANRRLRADVECGKRVAVQCTSKADAQAVHIALSKTFPEHKIWLLTSETPDKEDWERKTFSRFKTFQKFLIGHHTRKSRNALKHTSAQTLPPAVAPASPAFPTFAAWTAALRT